MIGVGAKDPACAAILCNSLFKTTHPPTHSNAPQLNNCSNAPLQLTAPLHPYCSCRLRGPSGRTTWIMSKWATHAADVVNKALEGMVRRVSACLLCSSLLGHP